MRNAGGRAARLALLLASLTRPSASASSSGPSSALFREQAGELDRARREAVLHRVQKLIHERAVFGPIWDFAFLHGVGPRVEEPGLRLLHGYGFSGPYEDVKLKGR